MIPGRLVVATANPGKLRELRALIGEWGPVTVEGLDAFPGIVLPAERGASYAENAVAKATAVARTTGVPALGDDSGLEVEALGGLPGLHSARYAGTEAARIAKLLEASRTSSPTGVSPARRACAADASRRYRPAAPGSATIPSSCPRGSNARSRRWATT